MLIEIDVTVKEQIERNIDNLNEYSPEIEIIEEIARSHFNNNHIIIAKKEVSKYFSKLKLLEKKVNTIYNTIHQRSAEYKMYKKLISQYVRILSDEFEFNLKDEDDKLIYEIPLSYLRKKTFLRESVLVTENLRDARLYKTMAKKYIKEVYKTNIVVKLEEMNGGGNDLYSAYENKINENRFVICIADSDKKYPQGNIGDTCRRAIEVYNKYKENKVIHMYTLGVREKENLIPPSFYMLCSKGVNRDSLKKLIILEAKDNPNSEFLKYLDIKDGVDRKLYEGKDEEYINYLDKIITEHPELVACDLDRKLQEEDKIILGAGSNAIDSFERDILNDNLDNILEKKVKASEKYNNPSIHKEINELKLNIDIKDNLFINIPEYIKSDWYELCDIIIAWGCTESFKARA